VSGNPARFAALMNIRRHPIQPGGIGPCRRRIDSDDPHHFQIHNLDLLRMCFDRLHKIPTFALTSGHSPWVLFDLHLAFLSPPLPVAILFTPFKTPTFVILLRRFHSWP